MSESRKMQYIAIPYDFIDSELNQKWDSRGKDLYWKMRRYVCRSSNHRLAGYWQNGYLATEGYLGTWASWFGWSKPVISRLLNEMVKMGIIVWVEKSNHAGKPNIFVLGKVIHVEGSSKTAEMFFLDYLAASETESQEKFYVDDIDLPQILPTDVHELQEIPMTVSLQKRTVSVEKRTVSVEKPSNIKYNIKENKKDSSPAGITLTEDKLQNESNDPFSELSFEDQDGEGEELANSADDQRKTEYVRTMEQLENTFAIARGCDLPDWSTPSAAKASNKRWRTPLANIWRKYGKNTPLIKDGIKAVTKQMMDDELTFDAPDQIIKSLSSWLIDHLNGKKKSDQPKIFVAPKIDTRKTIKEFENGIRPI